MSTELTPSSPLVGRYQDDIMALELSSHSAGPVIEVSGELDRSRVNRSGSTEMVTEQERAAAARRVAAQAAVRSVELKKLAGDAAASLRQMRHLGCAADERMTAIRQATAHRLAGSAARLGASDGHLRRDAVGGRPPGPEIFERQDRPGCQLGSVETGRMRVAPLFEMVLVLSQGDLHHPLHR